MEKKAGKITLPKDALQRIQVGQAFAEYDIIRKDPALFVKTPATLSAVSPGNTNCFFVGRRGAGKTAITYEIERIFNRSIRINPQIFDLLRLPLDHKEFIDTRQRPFKSLMASMERALIGEVIKIWAEKGTFKFDRAEKATRMERGLIEDCNFDQRVLNLTDEIFDAYSKENDKLWLRQISRSRDLIREVNSSTASTGGDYIILIDRLDESWDGSDSAVISLMALMHATVRIMAATDCIKPYIFIRENIYDRIRSLDNEFSRLETSVVFLDWTTSKLTELVERRLVKPFNTKPKLGGDAWAYFFEDESVGQSATNEYVMSLCQHRPRDVLMLSSFAINAAIAHGHTKINSTDLEEASTRYSTSRLKDLGDEFSENYSNIATVLGLFFGLGTEFTHLAIEDFVQKLLLNPLIQKLCADWVYEYSSTDKFIELLYSIGFLGIKRGVEASFKNTSKDSNAKPAFDSKTTFVIHRTYHKALNLRNILLTDLKDETILKNEGMLVELPESFSLETYKNSILFAQDQLRKIKTGTTSASDFETIVGEVIKLCFYRSQTNVEPHARTVNGVAIRDWITSNRASDGFWQVVREKYDATQVIWECKNTTSLQAEDFHQIDYYLNSSGGRFGIMVFRGTEIKESYLRHIQRIASKNSSKPRLVLLLTEKDLEVFLRQAFKGSFKDSHIQDRFDYIERKIS